MKNADTPLKWRHTLANLLIDQPEVDEKAPETEARGSS